MAKYIMSAFADEYSRDFDTQIKALCENGIGYIEPRFIGAKGIADINADEAREIKRKLDAAGIRASSVGSPLGKIKLSDDFSAHLETCRRVFETANILDTRNVRMFSFYAADGKNIADYRDEVIDKLGQMIELAGSCGLTLCHENEGGIYGETADACLDLLDTFGGWLRCVFDMGNFVYGGHDPVEAYGKLNPYIEYFHIKDALYSHAIVPPGCGEAKIAEILREHAERYDRDVFVTLEPHLSIQDDVKALTGREINSPYKFENKQVAFVVAADKLKEIIK
ncbi:MAG: sugar phosphate isomerase/epimerase [Clostridia bacterium]|nr:sugar phosphate isomerase/epimerase [Clostridia bacterium]